MAHGPSIVAAIVTAGKFSASDSFSEANSKSKARLALRWVGFFSELFVIPK